MRIVFLVFTLLLLACDIYDDYRERFLLQANRQIALATEVPAGSYSVELAAYWDGEQSNCWFTEFQVLVRTALGDTNVPIEIPNTGDDYAGPVAGKSPVFTLDSAGTLHVEVWPGTCLLLLPGVQTPGSWQVCHEGGCLPWDVADVSGYVNCSSSLGASVPCDGLVPGIVLNNERSLAE